MSYKNERFCFYCKLTSEALEIQGKDLKSCGICKGGGGSTCQNKHNSCAEYAKNGYCTNKYESWMDKNCKKSCGKC